MRDELERAIQDGRAAANLLNDELFKRVLQRVEDTVVAQWRNSEPGEDEARQSCYFLIKALDVVRNELRAIEGNGEVAQAKLQRQQQA